MKKFIYGKFKYTKMCVQKEYVKRNIGGKVFRDIQKDGMYLYSFSELHL